MKDRLETGRKFFRTSGSKSAFFRSGVTKARFKEAQKSPVESERFTSRVITVRRDDKQDLTSQVGRGSRLQDALELDLIVFATSSSETG